MGCPASSSRWDLGPVCKSEDTLKLPLDVLRSATVNQISLIQTTPSSESRQNSNCRHLLSTSFLSLLITASVGTAQWTLQRRVKCAAKHCRSSLVQPHFKTIHLAEAEITYENGGVCSGGDVGVLGLFSRVINKVCAKQQGTESLWFTGNGWCPPRGGITTASCLKKYHKDQANPPITPTWRSSEEFMENGKGWSPINTDAIVCSSQPTPCYSMLLFHSATPQFNPPPRTQTIHPTNPPAPSRTCNCGMLLHTKICEAQSSHEHSFSALHAEKEFLCLFCFHWTGAVWWPRARF